MDKHFGRMMRNMAVTRMADLHSGAWAPAVDLYESKKELVLCMELAGVEQDNINVVAEQEKIIISGARTVPCHGICRIHQLEIEYGHFNRIIPLPAHINVSETSSTLKNGFLLVKMPKLRSPEKVKITLS